MVPESAEPLEWHQKEKQYVTKVILDLALKTLNGLL